MLGLVFSTLVGAILRFVGIIKPEGLWNDEYVSWGIASTPFNSGFIEAMWAQCHMPLYYLYLKMCMAFGGESDNFLRITSFVPGVLSIIVMYFVGLQHSKKTAFFASLITALSSFLIYYSQEVRLYSLLFLFSAFSLLYLLKYIKVKSRTNFIGLILFDFIIMFTHTIGFVFVFFQLLTLSIILFKDQKKQILSLWFLGILSFLILLPNIWHILLSKTFSQWWGNFSISKLGFLFTDYFSPILTNLVNAPEKFLYNTEGLFLFFFLVPLIIALVLICCAVYKNRFNIWLLIMSVLTILIMVLAAVSGKLVFITKYSIEIYPILIYLAAYGASVMNKKYLGNIFIGCFCIINFAFLVFVPMSAPKMFRAEGHKIVADLINNAKPSSGDVIVLQYYPQDRFKKYFDFSSYKVVSVDKGNFYEFISPDYSYSDVYKQGKALYKPIFVNSQNGYFEYKLKKDVLEGMAQNQNIIVVVNDNVALFDNKTFWHIISDEYLYNKIPLMFMVFSYVRNRTYDYLSQNTKIVRAEKKGAWSVIKFTKLKE